MSGFKVFSTGQDLDAIFATRTGTDPSAQLVPFVTPAGQNLSERFLKYTSGTKVSATGYKCFDINGNMVDLSDLYSKILQFGWSALGGANDSVFAIYALDASNVYVGGLFTSVYSSGVSRIAKWNANTSTWSALGGGAQAYVLAIYALDSSNVYVGGQFSTVYSSGTTSVAGTKYIANWNENTSTWSALGGGAQSQVIAIYALDASNVYVGGNFTSVYSNTAGTTSVAGTKYIANWNGNNWSALGGGAQAYVNAIYALDSSNVYVGGQFSTVYSSGTTSVANTVYIAKWNGNNWSALGGGAQAQVRAIYALDASNVYVGGDFTSVYSIGTTSVAGTKYIAKWNGSSWSALGGGALGSVYAIYAVDASNVYVGGQFTTVYSSGTNNVNGTTRIAKWDGNNWSALGGGAQSSVFAINALDSRNLYVGGDFTSVYSIGTTSVAGTSRIAKWGYS